MATKSLPEVIELAQIVRRLRPKKRSRLSETGSNQESKLYKEILEAKSRITDESLMNMTGLSRRRYQQILSETKDWLLDGVLQGELPEGEFSEYARRLAALDRAHAQIGIIARMGAAYTANEEALFWLEEAKQLEEWRAAISLLSPLFDWASLSGNKAEYDRLKKEEARFGAIETALTDAKEVEQRVRIVFARSGAEHPELRKLIVPAIRRLQRAVLQHGTFRLQEALLMLRKKAQQVTTDYDEALAICDEMDQLLETYPLFSNRSRKSLNALSRLLCTVQTKHYEEAKRLVNSSEPLFDSGGQDWYSFQVWRFLLFMHTKAFGAAFTLVQEILARHDFSTQTEETRHLWRLFLGHAQFWTNQPVTDAEFKRNEKPGAIHARLMKQYPSFKGDYAGYEMAAILLEILVLLDQSRSDLISRTESLLKYKTRHLGKEDISRTNVIIDMMQLITLYDFDRARIVKTARPMLRRMLRIKTIDRVQAMQVMPYEMTWEAVEVALIKRP